MIWIRRAGEGLRHRLARVRKRLFGPREWAGGGLRPLMWEPAKQEARVRPAVEEFLGMPSGQGQAVARAVVALGEVLLAAGEGRRTDRGMRKVRFPRHESVNLSLLKEECESQCTPYLLALPLTGSSIAALMELSRFTRRAMFVEATHLTEVFLKPLLTREARTSVQFLPPGAMIRQKRCAAALGAELHTYVTFPDHHTAHEECCRPVPFFGSEHEFPLLEPLLHFRGASPILTISTSEHSQDGRWELVRYPASPPAAVGELTETSARMTLTWLAQRMEEALRKMPEDVLSWSDARALSPQGCSAEVRPLPSKS